jgi:hypothetical protein
MRTSAKTIVMASRTPPTGGGRGVVGEWRGRVWPTDAVGRGEGDEDAAAESAAQLVCGVDEAGERMASRAITTSPAVMAPARERSVAHLTRSCDDFNACRTRSTAVPGWVPT